MKRVVNFNSPELRGIKKENTYHRQYQYQLWFFMRSCKVVLMCYNDGLCNRSSVN